MWPWPELGSSRPKSGEGRGWMTVRFGQGAPRGHCAPRERLDEVWAKLEVGAQPR